MPAINLVLRFSSADAASSFESVLALSSSCLSLFAIELSVLSVRTGFLDQLLLFSLRGVSEGLLRGRQNARHQPLGEAC